MRRRVSWRGLFTLGLAAALAGVGLVLKADREARRAVLPPTVGNFGRVRDLLPPPPSDGHYRFAVVGDTRGSGTHEDIIQALQDEPLAFLVNLGDFVNHPAPAEHRFFTLEMAAEMLTPYPIFLVAGNHDVSPEGFSPADFETVYGPSQFTFRYGPDLFVVLCHIRGWPTASAEAFLRTVLQQERPRARHVFVFMHTPPPFSPSVAKVGAADPGRLMRMLERFRVTYVMAGDLHGYRRLERNGVRYLVSGGGGARLDKRSPYGRFFHAVVLEVGPDDTTEHILGVRRSWDFEDRLERWAVVCAAPWLYRYWYLAALAAVTWLALIVLAWRSLARSRHAPGKGAISL